ncbi:hypothetical protein GMST_05080 [Geomonas silvestris]|uniref:Uncharacterized protein n=1 Tax=Geomonas silvestris TaxID=2740184 RepID=A0A6V8MED1_9BACT|nr:formyltetrahydrofolate deformylase [Geomonas silvestris]GFO58183.1 hypothetical protein GMST_05080 [Geomonas silvestris]
MALIDQKNPHDNWFEALGLWNRLANWSHYRTSELEFKHQLKSMLIYLWNEKDWLVAQYPSRKVEIENNISESNHLSIVGDLANTVKHRRLSRKARSDAAQTDFFGRVTVNRGQERRLYFILLGNGQCEEIMSILRKALDELTELRHLLMSDVKDVDQG